MYVCMYVCTLCVWHEHRGVAVGQGAHEVQFQLHGQLIVDRRSLLNGCVCVYVCIL